MKKYLSLILAVMMLLAFTTEGFAACTQAFATSAKGNFLAGLFLKTDTYKIAHYADAATWSAATAQYSATNEVGTAGGYVLDTLAYGTSGTTYWMDFADEVNASTTFASASTCAIIYDDTAADTGCTASGAPYPCCTGSGTGTCANAVIGVFTYSSVQPNNGTLTVTFPAADASNAVIRLAIYDWLHFAMTGVLHYEMTGELPK